MMNTKAKNVLKLLSWSLALLLVASLALIETSATTSYAALARHGATGAGEEWGGEEGHGEEGGGEQWGGEEIYGAPAVGVIFVRPPAAAVPVVIGGARYWRYQDIYLVPDYSGEHVVYRVVPSPW
jgi:hypothetical protein